MIEDRKLATDLIVKAYEQHKSHARFLETQRYWMVTAYFTFSGLVYVGLFPKYTAGVKTEILSQLDSFGLVVLIVHLIIGMLMMIQSQSNLVNLDVILHGQKKF